MSVKALFNKPVFWESVLLSLMCMVDAWLTIMLVSNGTAAEANPVMAFYLSFGISAFVIAKAAFFVPGVIACEYLKHKNAPFALTAVRVATLGYFGVYLVGFLKINHLM